MNALRLLITQLNLKINSELNLIPPVDTLDIATFNSFKKFGRHHPPLVLSYPGKDFGLLAINLSLCKFPFSCIIEDINSERFAREVCAVNNIDDSFILNPLSLTLPQNCNCVLFNSAFNVNVKMQLEWIDELRELGASRVFTDWPWGLKITHEEIWRLNKGRVLHEV